MPQSHKIGDASHATQNSATRAAAVKERATRFVTTQPPPPPPPRPGSDWLAAYVCQLLLLELRFVCHAAHATVEQQSSHNQRSLDRCDARAVSVRTRAQHGLQSRLVHLQLLEGLLLPAEPRPAVLQRLADRGGVRQEDAGK